MTSILGTLRVRQKPDGSIALIYVDTVRGFGEIELVILTQIQAFALGATLIAYSQPIQEASNEAQ